MHKPALTPPRNSPRSWKRLAAIKQPQSRDYRPRPKQYRAPVRLGLALCLMMSLSACGSLFKIQKSDPARLVCPAEAMKPCDVKGFEVGIEVNADTGGELAIVTRKKLLECSARNDAKADCIKSQWAKGERK